MSILLVDPDEAFSAKLGWALSDFDLQVARDGDAAMVAFAQHSPAVVILSLGLAGGGGGTGLAVLEAMLAAAPDTKIIAATDADTQGAAFRAINLGAYDFFQKPINPEALRLIVARALRLQALEVENRRLLELAPRSPVDGIVGTSPQMARMLHMLEKIAPTDVSVLLLGESGTGKELLAQTIHRLSPRAKGPFVVVNCTALPETLLGGELFGHEDGAGRIDAAQQGTLFLDEVGDLPLPVQVKLQRFLEAQSAGQIGGAKGGAGDVRILCATNQDLDHMIGTGRFREDLYYRLNEVRLVVPALRDRDGDPIQLAHYFLKRFAGQFGRDLHGFAADAITAIAVHPWRGNVRELENRIKRAVVMAEGTIVTAADLELAPSELPHGSLDLREARARAERGVVQMALSQSGGNLSRAAKLLGISRPTLYGILDGLRLETQ